MTTSSHHRGVTLAVTWRSCVALYCVVMLYASLHELVHHVAGYAACGAWGYKTFNYFSTACEGSTSSWMATFAGPAFSYAMMWVGWWCLARAKSTALQRQLGFAMIFAQLPLQRLSGPLFGHNDEYFAAWHLFGVSATTRWVTFAVICACCIPPLVGAWRAIRNRRRAGWFLLYFTLLPYLLWGPFFALLEYLLTQRHVLDGQTIGIAHLFLINEVVTIIAFVFTKRWLDPAEAGPTPSAIPA
ncbi:MAG: hypothetical protein KA154_18655 [Gemmatimonadaceae bacterium]|nr:hypothetical protein [Gemmatimonadaceae bacterium]MCC6432727.1 hypothetical protein [Gemmatimonadaceae bacterium]